MEHLKQTHENCAHKANRNANRETVCKGTETCVDEGGCHKKNAKNQSKKKKGTGPMILREKLGGKGKRQTRNPAPYTNGRGRKDDNTLTT